MLASAMPVAAVQAQGSALPWDRPAVLRGAPTQAVPPRAIGWDALVPAGWDAMAGFRGVNLNEMDDKDPRAAALLKKMREAWDKAPVNMALMGQRVRISGYVVPLEEAPGGVTEFLLVPHFGACIHTPPPPANQVIHVLPRGAAKGVRTMSTVSVSGVLAYARNDSYMGASSWRMDAVDVELLPDGANTAPLR